MPIMATALLTRHAAAPAAAAERFADLITAPTRRLLADRVAANLATVSVGRATLRELPATQACAAALAVAAMLFAPDREE
jgi:hypothetical protein